MSGTVARNSPVVQSYLGECNLGVVSMLSAWHIGTLGGEYTWAIGFSQLLASGAGHAFLPLQRVRLLPGYDFVLWLDVADRRSALLTCLLHFPWDTDGLGVPRSATTIGYVADEFHDVVFPASDTLGSRLGARRQMA